MIKPIEQKQIDENSVSKLSTRPNAPSAMGGNGLNAAELRARFDALAILAIDKINELLAYLNGDELKDGTTPDSFASLIKFTGDDGVEYTLEEILDALQNGGFFPVDQSYSPNSTLPQSGTAVREIIDAVGKSVGETRSELIEYVDEKLRDLDIGDIGGTADPNYSPTSHNAQSGIAVKQAVDGVESQIPLVLPYTFEWGDTEKVAVGADNTVKSKHFNRTPKVGDIFLVNLYETLTDKHYHVSAQIQGFTYETEDKALFVLIEVFEYPTVDQLYAPDGANAQSGKAVRQAFEGHNTDTMSHQDIRLSLNDLATKLTNFLNIDEPTLDELSELIQAIQANKGSIAALTSGKVNVSDIADNLSTNLSDKPLSAAMGVKLKQLIDGVAADAKDYTDTQIGNSIDGEYGEIYTPQSTKAQSGVAVCQAIEAALRNFSPDGGGGDSGTVEGKLYHHLINIKGMGYITSDKMDANRQSELNVSLLLLDNNPNAYTSIQSLETIDKKGLLASGHICDYDSANTQFTVSSVDFGVSPPSEPYRRYIVLHCLHAQAASYAGGKTEAEIIVEYDIPTYDDVSFGIQKVSDTLRAIEVTSDLIDKIAQNAAGRVPKADKSYDPESTNAQSGKAVSEAVDIAKAYTDQEVETAKQLAEQAAQDAGTALGDVTAVFTYDLPMVWEELGTKCSKEEANQQFSNAATAHLEGNSVAITDISPIQHGVRVWDKSHPDMPVNVYVSENKFDASTSQPSDGTVVEVQNGDVHITPQRYTGVASARLFTINVPAGIYHFSCDFSHTGTISSSRPNEILFYADNSVLAVTKLTNGNTTTVVLNVSSPCTLKGNFYISVTSDGSWSTDYVATFSNIFIGAGAMEVEVEAGGTVSSLYPGMAITAKDTSTTLCVEYNRDINKVVDGLKTYVEQLLGVIENGTY